MCSTSRRKKMSADAEEPDQFRAWLCAAADPYPGLAPQFRPRELYGRYLADLVERTRRQFRGKVEAEHPVFRGCRSRQAAGDRWCVFHAAGLLVADSVVLATGHGAPQPAPAGVRRRDLACDHRRSLDAMVGRTHGARAHHRQRPHGHRHGPFPCCQGTSRKNRHAVAPWAVCRRTHVAHSAARRFPVLIPAAPRSSCAACDRPSGRGAPAQEWQAFHRRHAAALAEVWAALSEADKRRALRHGLSAFNTQSPPRRPHQGREIAAAIADGRVEIRRGRLLTLTPHCNSVRARIATAEGLIEPVFGRW